MYLYSLRYSKQIVISHPLLERSQCLWVGPFGVFRVNPNSWAVQVQFCRLPWKNISPAASAARKGKIGKGAELKGFILSAQH